MKPDRIIILLTASVVLIVISAVITHYAIDQSRNRVEWVIHTHLVIEQTTNLLSQLKDAESGQRGYLISGDSSYLIPYHSAIQKIPACLDSLELLVIDNPQQSKRLHEEIIPLVNRRMVRLREVMQLYTSEGFTSARLGLRTHEGKKIMDQLKASINTFVSNENLLLNDRLKEVARTHHQQNYIRFVSFFIIGFVCLLALVAIKRAQRQNEQLVSQLKDINRNLEDKVQQRTLELEKKNQLNEKLSRDIKENFDELQSFYEILQLRFERTQNASREIINLYNNPLCGYHSLNQNGLIVRMNKTELEWLGYSAEEVLNKKYLTDLIIPEEHQSYKEDFEIFKRQGFIKNKEHTLRRKDGSTFLVLLNSTALYDNNGIFSMSRGTLIDITDRKTIEIQLQELNQNLVRLNDEKNSFLAFAAHDLRSPLNGILGLINLIKLSGENLTEEQQSYIRYIEQNCSNMHGLITDLLDVSRIEQGLNTLKIETVNIKALIKSNVLSFKQAATQKNISLHVEDLTPDGHIHTDPIILMRILDNLVSNAIKFSPKGKKVQLKITHPESSHIRIEVIDQGPGIAQEEQGKLFQRFQRLSARPTDGESSTGLGLSIVKELTEALSGKISVDSEVNRGSTFILDLPIQFPGT